MPWKEGSVMEERLRFVNGLPELTYPFHDRDVLVTACGRICMHRKKINISTVLAGQKLGIKEVDDGYLARQFHAIRSRIVQNGSVSWQFGKQRGVGR